MYYTKNAASRAAVTCLDRGYFSKDNIRYIDENDYTFIIMCKCRKSLVSSLVLDNQGSFETKREAAIRA